VTVTGDDQGFIGPLPKVYQSHLVPLIFEPYAADLGNRLADRPVSRVLEIAGVASSYLLFDSVDDALQSLA